MHPSLFVRICLLFPLYFVVLLTSLYSLIDCIIVLEYIHIYCVYYDTIWTQIHLLMYLQSCGQPQRRSPAYNSFEASHWCVLHTATLGGAGPTDKLCTGASGPTRMSDHPAAYVCTWAEPATSIALLRSSEVHQQLKPPKVFISWFLESPAAHRSEPGGPTS